MQQRLYAELSARGFSEIRPAHSAVFRHIAPGGSRLTTLAEQAELTKQSMAYLVAYLEEHGYVRQKPDPEDGRAKQVFLTSRGEAFVNALLDAGSKLEQGAARKLGARRLKQLRTLLGELDAALEGLTR